MWQLALNSFPDDATTKPEEARSENLRTLWYNQDACFTTFLPRSCVWSTKLLAVSYFISAKIGITAVAKYSTNHQKQNNRVYEFFTSNLGLRLLFSNVCFCWCFWYLANFRSAVYIFYIFSPFRLPIMYQIMQDIFSVLVLSTHLMFFFLLPCNFIS